MSLLIVIDVDLLQFRHVVAAIRVLLQGRVVFKRYVAPRVAHPLRHLARTPLGRVARHERPPQAEQVLGIAWHYLSIMASCLCILYFLYVYRSALQGLGNTMLPMLSGVVEFFVRVGVALLLPKFIGQNGIFYAEIAAWTGAAVLLVVSYYISIRKFKSAN